ncbi:MAG: two sigma54 transcriptional regulator [Proteobacteria bacterium]|nr:two sigma54 transcriptional regulator [Pseudomonadota bacterium]
MDEGARILIVDDDPDMLHLIGVRLTAAGYQVTQAESGEAALISFRQQRPQLVITDLRMGEMDGLTLFDHLQKEAPTMPVIILTAHGTIPDAVSATHRGVFSFLTKPFDGQELLRRTADAIRLSPTLDPDQDSAQWRKELITVNVRMEELLRQALRISEESRTTLLVGPGGSGKSTLAKAIHQAGERADQPFVTLSCTDFPAHEQEQLLSQDDPAGVFAEAGNGVLYLQDVGTLSPLAQSRLFQLLFAQMQVKDPLHRLNAPTRRNIAPAAQVITSSPRPLDGAVAEGAFRSDLFYLLSGSTLLLPPLSDRLEDIPVLAKHFLSRLRPEANLALAPEALSALLEGRWPGNVRQLKNVLGQVAELSLTPIIPEAIVRRVMRELEEDCLTAFDDARRDFERDYLIRLLQTTGGNVAHAARVAQRNRTEFYKLLARHGLDPASFKQKFR